MAHLSRLEAFNQTYSNIVRGNAYLFNYDYLGDLFMCFRFENTKIRGYVSVKDQLLLRNVFVVKPEL